MKWAICLNDEVETQALALCQRNIVLGAEAISGSTLRGRARGRYKDSSASLLKRLTKNSATGPHNARQQFVVVAAAARRMVR